jgi:peptidyl-prolyl cis-trans isomerase B (cyclophilin B)
MNKSRRNQVRRIAGLSIALALAATRSGALMAQDSRENRSPEDNSLITNYFEIDTRHGRMVVRLYDETPGHRDNFAKLVGEGFYDGTTFHRVIANFMVQGGDPNSKNDDPMDDGLGGPGYTVPAEISTTRFHKRGALAAARQADQVNPNRASSGSQFFIVHGGTPFDAATLAQIEPRLRQQIPDTEFSYTPEMVRAYTTEGGAPHLDGMYTVFGELVEGFEVLDLIAAEETARSKGEQTHPALTDQPLEPVVIEVRPLEDYTPPSPTGGND